MLFTVFRPIEKYPACRFLWKGWSSDPELSCWAELRGGKWVTLERSSCPQEQLYFSRGEVWLWVFQHARHLAACEVKQGGPWSNAKIVTQLYPKLLRSKGMTTICHLMNCVNTPSVCFIFYLKGELFLFVSVNEKSLPKILTLWMLPIPFIVYRESIMCALSSKANEMMHLPQGARALVQIQSVSGTDSTWCASTRCLEVK